ncbi:hypothetical protein [Flavobacterium sp.]|uniref:hypothetical protein n=1 Tax=Flavobacterium sp. TaxID=239 RepID=UPI00286B3508|nr:hypothetical protein [Flavobacterium sp.]
MRKFIILSFMLIAFFANGQEVLRDTLNEASVEKNLYGVQLGIVNASFQYETKLNRKIVLRMELGAEQFYYTIDYNNPNLEDKKFSLIVPYFCLEPRWYYSIDRRNKLGRNIKGNSSNYVSLRTAYLFGNSPITNSGNYDVNPSIYIVPKYGIRRVFAKRFNYEFSGGVGYQQTFNNYVNDNNVFIDLQARIGYNF